MFRRPFKISLMLLPASHCPLEASESILMICKPKRSGRFDVIISIDSFIVIDLLYIGQICDQYNVCTIVCCHFLEVCCLQRCYSCFCVKFTCDNMGSSTGEKRWNIYCGRTRAKTPIFIADSWSWEDFWFLEIYLKAVRVCLKKLSCRYEWRLMPLGRPYDWDIFFQGEFGKVYTMNVMVRIFYITCSCLKALTARFPNEFCYIVEGKCVIFSNRPLKVLSERTVNCLDDATCQCIHVTAELVGNVQFWLQIRVSGIFVVSFHILYSSYVLVLTK